MSSPICPLDYPMQDPASAILWIMEQCLGDQQFTTPLLYLEGIYIFAPNVDAMLDWKEMVFNRLKNFHLKIKPKVPPFPIQCCIFRPCPSCRWHFSQSRKGHEEENWPLTKSTKSYIHFLALHLYRCCIPNFAHLAQCLHNLVQSVPKKKKKKGIQRKPVVQVSQPILKQNPKYDLLSGWKNIRLLLMHLSML